MRTFIFMLFFVQIGFAQHPAVLYDNGVEIKRGEYPRSDMGPIENLSPGLEWQLIQKDTMPDYDPLTQKIETITTPSFSNSIDYPYLWVTKTTYNVAILTGDEIQFNKKLLAKENQEKAIDSILKKQIIVQAQAYDDSTSLDNKDLFPLWEVDKNYQIGDKVQDFDANNMLVLYKCVQAHISQLTWRPKDTPALFTKVAYPNQILDFVQPTGAQDAYMIGDQVYFPAGSSTIYESTIDNNIWSPSDYPAGWTQIN